MVQAAISAASGLLGNQTRRVTDRPAVPYTAHLIAAETNKKKIKQIQKAAKDDRIMYLLSQPEFIGILITIAGIYASQNIPFSENDATNEGLQAISTMSSVLIGLGYAGVGDLTTLLAACIAAGFSLTELLGEPFGSIGKDGLDLGWFKYFSPFNLLVDRLL